MKQKSYMDMTDEELKEHLKKDAKNPQQTLGIPEPESVPRETKYKDSNPEILRKKQTIEQIEFAEEEIKNTEMLADPVMRRFPIIKTHHDGLDNSYKEVNNLPDMTIPDQGMSVGEILRRFSRGLPLVRQTPMQADDKYNYPNLAYMDLAERQTYLEDAKEELKQLTEKLNKKAKDQAKPPSIDSGPKEEIKP